MNWRPRLRTSTPNDGGGARRSGGGVGGTAFAAAGRLVLPLLALAAMAAALGGCGRTPAAPGPAEPRRAFFREVRVVRTFDGKRTMYRRAAYCLTVWGSDEPPRDPPDPGAVARQLGAAPADGALLSVPDRRPLSDGRTLFCALHPAGPLYAVPGAALLEMPDVASPGGVGPAGAWLAEIVRPVAGRPPFAAVALSSDGPIHLRGRRNSPARGTPIVRATLETADEDLATRRLSAWRPLAEVEVRRRGDDLAFVGRTPRSLAVREVRLTPRPRGLPGRTVSVRHPLAVTPARGVR